MQIEVNLRFHSTLQHDSAKHIFMIFLISFRAAQKTFSEINRIVDFPFHNKILSLSGGSLLFASLFEFKRRAFERKLDRIDSNELNSLFSERFSIAIWKKLVRYGSIISQMVIATRCFTVKESFSAMPFNVYGVQTRTQEFTVKERWIRDHFAFSFLLGASNDFQMNL